MGTEPESYPRQPRGAVALADWLSAKLAQRGIVNARQLLRRGFPRLQFAETNLGQAQQVS